MVNGCYSSSSPSEKNDIERLRRGRREKRNYNNTLKANCKQEITTYFIIYTIVKTNIQFFS